MGTFNLSLLLWEARMGTFNLLYTLRGTLVGEIYPIIHPERHPGGYTSLLYTLRGTLVGICLPTLPRVYLRVCICLSGCVGR